MKRRTAYNILLALGIWVLALLAVKSCVDMPLVTFSYSQGKCVDVWDKDGIYSCDNMPPRYERIWRE